MADSNRDRFLTDTADRPTGQETDARLAAPAGPVMSEYERQRLAYRREQKRARLLRWLFRGVAALLLVLAGYAVAGYLSLNYLPGEIARLEGGVSARARSGEALSQGAGHFRARLNGLGLASDEAEPAQQLPGLVSFLKDPAVMDLAEAHDPALGKECLRRLTQFQKELAVLEKDLGARQIRVKMLDRELNGPVGKGSAYWKQKRAKAQDELDRAVAGKTELVEKRDRYVREKVNRARALMNRLSRDALDYGERQSLDAGKLENLKTWRDRLKIWPLPQLEGLFKAKEA